MGGFLGFRMGTILTSFHDVGMLLCVLRSCICVKGLSWVMCLSALSVNSRCNMGPCQMSCLPYRCPH